MYKNLLSLLTFFILLNSSFGQFKKDLKYVAPIKSPYSFSGGFGELRKNHFHTGLDFRTGGQIGMPVLAVQEGFISRVSVSPFGYGHALYLTHPDGHTTVYGHLSKFNSKIEDYVISQQYKLRQFAVDLTIPSGLISFQKGEIIAWSGNTGSSGGPHLHFEIRDTKSEKPQNPLFYLSGITDKSSPRITSLYVYPLNDESAVNKRNNKLRVETLPGKQITKLKYDQPIEVFGKIGIGIQSDDDFNGVGLKCGIYSAELFEDQVSKFSFKLDHLSFDQGKYVNSHIDYEELIKSRRWIHKFFVQPGNMMEIYQFDKNRGALNLSDGKIHTIKIVVSDAFNNTNVLTFKLFSKKIILPPSTKSYTKLFYYDKGNDFETPNVKIQLSAGTLYDRLYFNYHIGIKKNTYYSKVHQIHNQYVPVHKPYLLSIRTEDLPPKFRSKALIALVDHGGRLSPIGGEYSDSWVTAHPRTFGDFTVVLDTIPPKILPISIKASKTLTDRVKIEFKISDNLSGIENYEGEIDGNWVLFEYDAKNQTLTYFIDKKRLSTGKMHNLILRVGDERKNLAEYKANFYL